MPYRTTKELPESVREHLPEHAREIYLAAYNSAWDEYADAKKRQGNESQEEAAFRVAWAAVKHQYEQNERTGQWESKRTAAR